MSCTTRRHRTRVRTSGVGYRRTLLLSCILFAAAETGNAQDFTLHAALTSDYVYRGVSNSDEHAALQLGVDLSTEAGFYGGIWASSTDITVAGRNRPQEIDYYVGYVRHFDNDWSASVSVNQYTYPGSDADVDYDYTEFSAVVGFQDRLWLEFNYTDSFWGHREQAGNVEVMANWPLPAALTLSTGLGYFDVSAFAGDAYAYWQLGVSRPLGWATIDLRYHDTSGAPARISQGDLADPRLVLAISAAF